MTSTPVQLLRTWPGLSRGGLVLRSVAQRLAPLLALALALIAWEVAVTQVHARNAAVPAPSTVLRTLFAERELMWKSLQPTLLEAGLGFLLGNSVAILLAATVVRWPTFELPVLQVSVTMHALPVVAVAPLLVLWLGTGYAPRVVIAALSCFFPTVVNAARGFQALDADTADLMRVIGANQLQTLFKARLPTAVPYLFASFKIGAPGAVVGAVLGEWIGAEQGLGLLMLWAMFTHLVPRLWATVLVSAVVAALAYLLAAVLERLLAPWAAELTTN